MTTNQYNLLFRVASKFLKYFLLAILGIAIVSAISISLGGASIVTVLLPFIADWIVRIGLIIFCLLAIAIIIESLR